MRESPDTNPSGSTACPQPVLGTPPAVNAKRRLRTDVGGLVDETRCGRPCGFVGFDRHDRRLHDFPDWNGNKHPWSRGRAPPVGTPDLRFDGFAALGGGRDVVDELLDGWFLDADPDADGAEFSRLVDDEVDHALEGRLLFDAE